MTRLNPLTAILVAWMLAHPALAALDDRPQWPLLPQPATDLGPEDVVRIVIHALARNDQPYTDAGIETTFGFASPNNKVNTGPLDKFIRLVKAPPYGVMLDHLKSEFSEIVRVGEDAYQLVHLTTRTGDSVVFAFRLSRQTEGRYQGMWMTDAVWPVSQ